MIMCIDLDDTLALSAETILEYAIDFDKNFLKRNGKINEVKYSTDYYYFAKMLNWNDEDVIAFFNKCYLKYLPAIKAKEYSSDFCKKIKLLGIKIYIITSRREKENDIVLNCTKNWLNENNILYDKLFINIIDKGKFLKEINPKYFIDDSISNCISVKKNCPDTKTILITTKYNQSIICNNNIYRLDNLKKIYDFIYENEKK